MIRKLFCAFKIQVGWTRKALSDGMRPCWSVSARCCSNSLIFVAASEFRFLFNGEKLSWALQPTTTDFIGTVCVLFASVRSFRVRALILILTSALLLRIANQRVDNVSLFARCRAGTIQLAVTEVVNGPKPTQFTLKAVTLLSCFGVFGFFFLVLQCCQKKRKT